MRVGEVGRTIDGDVVKLDNKKYGFLAGRFNDALHGMQVYPKREKPYTVVSAWRYDIDGTRDYKFYIAKKRGKIIITAGCRYFTSVETAKSHWSKIVSRDLHSSNIGYENRKYKNEEAIRIIDKLLAKLKKRGV